jgi:protease-4
MEDQPSQNLGVAPTTPQHEQRRRRRRNPLFWILGLSAALFLILVLVSGRFLFRGSISGGGGHSIASSRERVGVIELNGIILESKKILKQLTEFEEDSSVKAVVLRMNSPGGAVAPSQEIYQAVKKFPKPLVVSMSSVAASGAYYIAAGSKKVFANPGTITGSIGVIMQFTNLEKLYDWAKITRYSIKTGKFKDAGAEYRPMTPEERELLQAMINDTLTQFKAAVGEGRKLTVDQVDAVADGRIFSGVQAKQAKLVDELGSLQDAIDEAARQAKIEGRPKVVYPEKPRRRLIEWLISDDGEESESESRTRAASGLGLVLQKVLDLPRPSLQLEPGIYWLLPWGA